MSIREAIDHAQDCKTEAVEVPEWSTTVYVKMLTGEERERVERDISKAAKTEQGPVIARLVCATLCEADGKLVYEYPREVGQLNKKSMKVLQRLFDVALKLNALGKDDVEALEKN